MASNPFNNRYHNPYPYICGCYYYNTHVVTWQPRIKQYLPLLDSEAHSTILSTTSKTVLKQTFTNPSSDIAINECVYTFPLYDGVSVVGFTCRIGSRTLRGLVKEKTQAKEIFDQAVAKGETAGLLEQSPEASDVFSTKLGNIPAGQSVIVEITYIGELKHHETEGVRFIIPTSIAPRYGQSPNHALAPGTSALPDGGIKITVDVNMPEGSFIKGVQSPSHPIAVSMGALSTAADADPTLSKASATLSLGSAALEKDFVLIVQSKDIGIPKAILETHPTIPRHRALMATLVPKFSLPPSRPEIVFVADRSGSMRGNIPMLISAMKVFLKSMPVGVKFNICSFGNHCTFLWKQSKSYSSDTLAQATSHVECFNANMGGTETFNAVRQTIEQRFKDISLEIVLLTDGDIWRQEELFNYINQQVKETNGQVRVFPLGIGNGVSSALIEGLARAGNGFSQSVQTGERLDKSVVRMLRGALTPHITDYTLEVKYGKDDDDFELIDKVTEGMKVLLSDADKAQSEAPKPTISLFDLAVDPEKEDVKMQDVDYLPHVPYPKLLQAPHQIPSLFAFSRTSVYLLMSPETIQRNPIAIILRATSAHGPLALEIPIETLATPGETIHQLAARKAVQDLEEGRGWIFNAKDQAGVLIKDRYASRFDDLVQREAVRLGEKFQVAGKWCSFVAVAANDAEIAAKEAKQEKSVAEQSGSDELSPDFGLESGDVLQDFDFDSFLATPASTTSPNSQSFSPISPSSSPQMQQSANPQNLQDYQMKLMQLEQQNKKRNMMSRNSGPMTQSISPQTQSGGDVDINSSTMHQKSPDGIAGYYNAGEMAPQQPRPAEHALFGYQAGVMAQQQQQQQQALFSFAPLPRPGMQMGMQARFVTRNSMPLQHQATGFAPQQPASSPFGLQQSMHRMQSPSGFGGSAQPSSGGLSGSAALTSPRSGGTFSGRSDSKMALTTGAKGSTNDGFGAASKEFDRGSNNPSGIARLNITPPPAPATKSLHGMMVGSQTFCEPSQSEAELKRERNATVFARFRQRRGSTYTYANLQNLVLTADWRYVIPTIANSNSGRSASGSVESAYSSPAPISEDWTTKSVSEKVFALIFLQDFEGLWSDNTFSEVARIMGCEVPKAPQGIDQKAWVTLLLVSYLEANCAAEEETWSLVAEKARDWLSGSWSAAMSLDKAEKEAKAFWKA